MDVTIGMCLTFKIVLVLFHETHLFKNGLSQKVINSSIPQVGRELTKESRKIRGFFDWDINFKVAKTHTYRYVHFLHSAICLQ